VATVVASPAARPLLHSMGAQAGCPGRQVVSARRAGAGPGRRGEDDPVGTEQDGARGAHPAEQGACARFGAVLGAAGPSPGLVQVDDAGV